MHYGMPRVLPRQDLFRLKTGDERAAFSLVSPGIRCVYLHVHRLQILTPGSGVQLLPEAPQALYMGELRVQICLLMGLVRVVCRAVL